MAAAERKVLPYLGHIIEHVELSYYRKPAAVDALKSPVVDQFEFRNPRWG